METVAQQQEIEPLEPLTPSERADAIRQIAHALINVTPRDFTKTYAETERFALMHAYELLDQYLDLVEPTKVAR